ncbi:hypothetical protein ACFQZ8_03855 [Micromonospora azadirachtae]|uniref:Uncharacterized protein n=1 Tax=Micromonospora azadirachtae TaxID=1970735 RepID=A0ABW2ZWP1_9ACTN
MVQVNELSTRVGRHIDLPREALPALLTSVHRDLVGFVAVLVGWAERLGLEPRGGALVKAIDRDFAITTPFDLATACEAQGWHA